MSPWHDTSDSPTDRRSFSPQSKYHTALLDSACQLDRSIISCVPLIPAFTCTNWSSVLRSLKTKFKNTLCQEDGIAKDIEWLVMDGCYLHQRFMYVSPDCRQLRNVSARHFVNHTQRGLGLVKLTDWLSCGLTSHLTQNRSCFWDVLQANLFAWYDKN